MSMTNEQAIFFVFGAIVFLELFVIVGNKTLNTTAEGIVKTLFYGLPYLFALLGFVANAAKGQMGTTSRSFILVVSLVAWIMIIANPIAASMTDNYQLAECLDDKMCRATEVFYQLALGSFIALPMAFWGIRD